MVGIRLQLGLIATILSAANPSGALELLAPSSDVATHENHLIVVGSSDGDTVWVELEGERILAAQVEHSFFHVRIELNVGLHEFEIVDDLGERQTLNLLAGPKIDRSYRTSFADYRFHSDVPSADCAYCHDPGEPNLDVATLTGWCMDCHPDVETKFTRHAGNQLVSCADCHPINADLTVDRPRSHADANPCYGCHTDKIGEFAQEFVHGPVAGGACTICHDAHGSDFANTLNQPAVLLCLSCHDDLDPDGYLVPHQPFVNGQCVDCHDPHATRNRWVLVRSSEELCFPCHGSGGEISQHNHPYNVKPRRKLDAKLHLTPSGRLECLSCHEAHGGSQRALLRSPSRDLCTGCHPRHG